MVSIRFALAAFIFVVTARATIEPGEILIGELNCGACHDAAPALAPLLQTFLEHR